MTTPRDIVLGNIRSALGRSSDLSPAITESLSARTAKHPRGPQPEFPGEPVSRFVAKMNAVGASCEAVADLATAGAAVLTYLENNDLPLKAVTTEDAEIMAVPWSNRLQLEHGRAALDADEVSITGAFAGVAETGTLFLLSSAPNPTTLNFLPETHVVIVRAERILRHLEDGWDLLRRELGDLPRTVNLISGPSKTADVEQTIQQGAHGPRRLHVIVVDHV